MTPRYLTLPMLAGALLLGGLAIPPADAAATKPAHEHHQAADKASYTCPMHPEVTSEKPGRCPKCKMYLVKADNQKVEADKAKHDHAKHQAAYVCPMHPEVTSDKPGRCPECKMHLVKAKK